MCDQDEKKQGNEEYESFHVNSINVDGTKPLTIPILPYAYVREQKMLQLGLLSQVQAVLPVVVFGFLQVVLLCDPREGPI